MPLVDVIDESFVHAPGEAVAARLTDDAHLRRWWPELTHTVLQDRGPLGVRWAVTGALVGSAEFWLEPWGDGVVAHYFLRADPTIRGSDVEPRTGPPARMGRLGARLVREYTLRVKRVVWELKDAVEADRPVGVAAQPGVQVRR